MIELGGVTWADLQFSDIENLLVSGRDEDFFLDYKADKVSPDKIAKEICAFANTYGGYIIIGVSDDKKIDGCTEWTENRVHTSVYNMVFPVPVFEVKILSKDNTSVLIIRVEEGPMPPYFTNKGIVYERVSSGSHPIQDSGRLQYLMNKRNEGIAHINEKIGIPEIRNIPHNYCGYIDLGFSLTTRAGFSFSKDFYSLDMKPVVNTLRENGHPYSISRLANSYVFTIGKMADPNDPGRKIVAPSGICYFMEVFRDGSMRARLPLISNPPHAGEIRMIEPMIIHKNFEEVYARLLNCDLSSVFISAQKYEKLNVYEQFTPVFDASLYKQSVTSEAISKRNIEHMHKYGENIIPIGHRIPISGFTYIDKREMEKQQIEFNSSSILSSLFFVEFFNFGFIDDVQFDTTES